MAEKLDVKSILFFDIETVPLTASFSELNEELQHLWADKAQRLQRSMPDRFSAEVPVEEQFNNAGTYAEFARVACISVGFFADVDGETCFRVKSFYNDDEAVLLQEFKRMIDAAFSYKGRLRYLCGHNIKEFDVPFICRRMLVNGIELPSVIDVAGKKPWEVGFVDTLELWRFGDYKNYTSLKTLTAIFGIPTPKDDIDGSQVRNVYYEEHDLERIATYCQKDVVATARVYMRMRMLPFVAEDKIIIVK